MRDGWVLILASKPLAANVEIHVSSMQRKDEGTREHIPGVGTNHRGLGSIFQGLEPITVD
eukprot:2229036-Pyramimonas_sp.AAC.1